MRFSGRTPEDLSPNPLTLALERLGIDSVINLTESNPTLCGFDYPPDLLKGLDGPQSLRYSPEPFGNPGARKALSGFLKAKGQAVDPENILLTAGTSEAYSYLFKLFGDPGDAFLVPTPGYPLLEHLAALEGVRALPYRLKVDASWPLDFDSLEGVQDPRTKGFVTIQPHNPTGSLLTASEQSRMEKLCRQNQWMVISDEVFQDYVDGGPSAPWAPEGVLSFRLGGLSKSLALPQLKLAWMILQGPDDLVRDCRGRMELVADTYLSVNSPVQGILGDLLGKAPLIQNQIRARLKANQTRLAERFKGHPVIKAWPRQGGWYQLLELRDSKEGAEALALDLLEKQKVLVHPGGLYDFPAERNFWVVSLLPPPERFIEGLNRMGAYFRP